MENSTDISESQESKSAHFINLWTSTRDRIGYIGSSDDHLRTSTQDRIGYIGSSDDPR